MNAERPIGAGAEPNTPASTILLEEMTRLHPKLIDLSLGRIDRLLAKLGNPHLALPPVIHIAGTNGKGSSAAYLRAMLEAAGRRVHVYTSPHLVRFHERIALAGGDGTARPIDEARLVEVLERVLRISGDDPITQFEITTAAAFLAFAETPADAVVLEVGLGGRLDATNVVPRPAATLVTPIAMDHAEKLGSTLAAIAAEKAGILKNGVGAVVSEQPDEALAVIRNIAGRIGAPLLVAGEDYHVSGAGGRLVVQIDDPRQGGRLLDLPMPVLIGPHQLVNAAGAVVTALVLDAATGGELRIEEAAIARGLVTAEWPARMQRLDRGPLLARLPPEAELWLDGGHNPAGAKVIADTLVQLEERSPKPLELIVGMMGQKDVAGFLVPFRGLARSITTVPIPGAHEPPHAPHAIADIARGLGFEAHVVDGVEQAIDRLQARSRGPMRVLICGSLYLAGHVLALHTDTETG